MQTAPVGAVHTLLYLDADADRVLGFRTELAGLPVRVVVASSARHGAYQLASDTFELVVSTEDLPDVPGESFLRAVQDQYPEMTVRLQTHEAPISREEIVAIFG